MHPWSISCFVGEFRGSLRRSTDPTQHTHTDHADHADHTDTTDSLAKTPRGHRAVHVSESGLTSADAVMGALATCEKCVGPGAQSMAGPVRASGLFGVRSAEGQVSRSRSTAFPPCHPARAGRPIFSSG